MTKKYKITFRKFKAVCGDCAPVMHNPTRSICFHKHNKNQQCNEKACPVLEKLEVVE